MKGLASTSATFASVRISGRSARKHYGLLGAKKFDEALHDSSRRSVTLSSWSSNLCLIDHNTDRICC